MGDGPVLSQLALLWYLLSPLFCEWAWQCLRLELFTEKFSLSFSLSFLSLSLWLSHGLGCYLTLAPSDCPRAFRPGPDPKLRILCLPVQPPLLVVDASIWATSPLGAVVRLVICGFYVFFPPSYVAL